MDTRTFTQAKPFQGSDTINPWEVNARTKKVRKILACIDGNPIVTEAIVEGYMGFSDWEQLGRIAGVIAPGEGTKRAVRQILLAREQVSA